MFFLFLRIGRFFHACKNSGEPADKPGSVLDNHSSGICVAADLKQPTREPARAARAKKACSPIWSCSRWGLPCRGMLPPARCALTAPFHPCRRRSALAVYSLLHFPWAHAPQVLPGTSPYGARTFLCTKVQRLPGRLPASKVRPASCFLKHLLFPGEPCGQRIYLLTRQTT